MKMLKSKKGSFALLVTFFLTAFILIVFSAVMAPVGSRFNTEMYRAGEDILEKTNDSIQLINNPAVKESLTNSTNAALATTEMNIEVNNSMFKYGWLIVVGLTCLIIFLIARSTVEYNVGRVI